MLLHGILKLAKRRKWISTNPAEDAERVSVKRSGDFNVLDPEQIYAVARAATSEQDAAIVTFAAFSGLRMGEIRALRWLDVDFAAQTIFVRRSYTAGELGPPKGGKIRSVPLIDQAARALDGLSRRELHTEPGDLIFPSPTGGYPDEGKMRKNFYAAMKAAGIDRKDFPARGGFTFHDLRHTFGTLGAAEWPLHDLQGYMGHANIQTTMIYVHHVPKTSAAAQLTRAIDAALSNGEAQRF